MSFKLLQAHCYNNILSHYFSKNARNFPRAFELKSSLHLLLMAVLSIMWSFIRIHHLKSGLLKQKAKRHTPP
uniref:Uncharacterized protein n=1 Tax=Populus trichocarpa TaxID=3694 RepID=A0A2K2ANA0_POPTR